MAGNQPAEVIERPVSLPVPTWASRSLISLLLQLRRRERLKGDFFFRGAGVVKGEVEFIKN